jgi:23S rRNA pseudouridine1911/1915/1917 synthase
MNSELYHVVYEDNHIIAVNKAAGLLVQGDQTGDLTLPDLVKSYLKIKYDKPGDVFLGVVHRLDRPVSGLVILARTSKALERMAEIFRRRQIQKTYWAVTKNRPEFKQDKLVHYLVKNEANNTVRAHDYEVEGSLRAELSYRVMGTLNDHWLLEVQPITGRPHQIRVQLAAIGCPIRGDVKYGFSKPNPDGSINLHSRKAYFMHPVKKEPLILTAGVPSNPFWEQFLTLEELNVKDKNFDFLY